MSINLIVMKKLVLVFAFALIATVSMAQTTPVKVGYADVEYIFSLMPESKKIEKELEDLRVQLKKQYDSQVATFQKKVEEYQKFGATAPEAVRQNSERELNQMRDNIQKLEQDSQAEMQKRNTTLLTPVQEKVGKVIEEVAKENGFSMILTSQISGLEVILYVDEKLDISDLVLKKMGITPPPASAPAATTNPK
jgi:outer membrane protein